MIVKPHPGAILPLAITVKIGRDVLKEAGFDPNVLMLAPDEADAPITQELVAHPGIAIVDFTGSPAFGQWVRENAATDLVYTEEAGINSIVIDSTDDFRGMCGNIAFSLSLYSGQMCTAPQNIFVPAGGIETNDGHKSYDEVASGIATAIDKLLGDPDRAANILGTIQNEATVEARRTPRASSAGSCAIPRPMPVAGFDQARTASPLLLAVDAKDDRAWGEERFGPIAFVIRTESTEDSIALASQSARRKGAITASLYSTNDGVIDAGGRRLRARRCRIVGQPDRRHLRQPVGGVLGLSRLRRQSGRQCVPDRLRLRRQSFPRRSDATPKSSLNSQNNIQGRISMRLSDETARDRGGDGAVGIVRAGAAAADQDRRGAVGDRRRLVPRRSREEDAGNVCRRHQRQGRHQRPQDRAHHLRRCQRSRTTRAPSPPA